MQRQTRTFHNWIGQTGNDALWKCSACGKLDWDILPDQEPTCVGSFSVRIQEEINEAANARYGSAIKGDLTPSIQMLPTFPVDVEASLERLNRMQAALERIDAWAKAYPLDVFPEPDFGKVREVLRAAGIPLGCVGASNMRHVLDTVKQIVAEALDEPRENPHE